MNQSVSTANSCSDISVSPLGYYKDLKEVMGLVEMEKDISSIYLHELFFPALGRSLEDFNQTRAYFSLHGSFPYKICNDETLIGLVFVVQPEGSDQLVIEKLYLTVCYRIFAQMEAKIIADV